MTKEWKPVAQYENNPLWKHDKRGDAIEGVYKGSREVENYGLIYTVEVKGVLTDFWGTGQLNYTLKNIPVDTEVRIEYKGTEKVKVDIKGKKVTKDVHQFAVLTR